MMEMHRYMTSVQKWADARIAPPTYEDGFYLRCEEMSLEYVWNPLDDEHLVKVYDVITGRLLHELEWIRMYAGEAFEHGPEDWLIVWLVGHCMAEEAFYTAKHHLGLDPSRVVEFYGESWTFRPLTERVSVDGAPKPIVLSEPKIHATTSQLLTSLEQDLARQATYQRWLAQRDQDQAPEDVPIDAPSRGTKIPTQDGDGIGETRRRAGGSLQ
jgi:hypothetical protein